MSTLQERAIIPLAINLCQRNSFKELVLCLAKPTYGSFSSNLFFASDQKNCVKKPYVREQLDVALEKECQRLAEEIPYLFRDRVRIWINRISLEYQSYRCRMELLFGMSRYLLMTILSIGDWRETGRLDEKKVALRLLEDKRLTVFQKYHIACVYCLHAQIPELWKKVTEEEIPLIIEDTEMYRERIIHISIPYQGKNILVSFWSEQMRKNEIVTEIEPWVSATYSAIYLGNRAAVAMCWERLDERVRKNMVVRMALQSSLHYKERWQSDLNLSPIEILEEISWPDTNISKGVFSLRSHYAELMLFFLSQMDGTQKWTFFKKAFSKYRIKLECFLDWPLQDELLQTIDILWGIITKDDYASCMLSLAEKCSDGSTKENHVDEYRSLFWKLWGKTRHEFKQYILKTYSFDLLHCLLPRSTFLKEDEALFNHVFSDLSQEGRREMMLCKDGSKFIAELLEQRRWPYVNWFLEECLLKEEISSLKKKFIQSEFGCCWCLCNLRHNRENFVEDVIDWCFEFDSEKSQFKWELMISENLGVKTLVCNYLREGNFAKVERMVNFFASSEETKMEVRAHFALWACQDLLGKCRTCVEWTKMDEMLSWSLASDDKIKDIKKRLLCQEGIKYHFQIAFLGGNWEEVERFYKWFDLSSEEVEDIIFDDMYLSKIANLFLTGEKDLVTPLRRFLTNEEKVMRFKERLERKLEGFGVLEPVFKKSLDYLESELHRGLRKEEIQNETSRGGTFVENKGEK